MPIIIFLAGLQSIPTEITEAARIDGATSKQVFWNIELPYLLPSVSMVFILALKGGLTAFDQVFAMTGGGPNNATTSLGLLVYNYAFKNNQFGYANAIAVILFFLIVVISIIQLRVFAGIDKESRTKVMTLIMRQLNDLKRGKFTESELQLTKEMLVNTTLLAQDRQNTLIEREYLKTILGKKVLSLEEWLESIDKVSREEIIEVAKTINLQSVYFMEGK